MKLICPSCGGVHSAEAWQNDPIARQCLRLVCEMPHSVSKRCFAYLTLFRSPGRSLRWKTVLTLLAELKDRVSEPYVQWKRQVARPSSASVWGDAMERMIECPPKHLPLKSHGYLRSVVYEIADDLDRQKEVKKNQEERTGTIRGQRSGAGDHGDLKRLTIEDKIKIRKKNYPSCSRPTRQVGKKTEKG